MLGNCWVDGFSLRPHSNRVVPWPLFDFKIHRTGTLVSQIIVLHSLLTFKKIPACTSLFQSAQLLIFENFPTCTFILACTFVWKRKKSYLFINKFWILPLFQVNFRMLQVHQMFLQGSFKKAINFSPCMVIPSCKTNNFCKFSSLHIYSSLHI